MKIVQLNVENVKRLTAVNITPDGSTVIVGGLNGAGKSSVLDAISMALGGSKLVPEEPIHTGESEAKIEVDLGKYTVTRKFARDKIYSQCDPDVKVGGGDVGVIVGHEHNEKCMWSWGPTRSSLIIRTKDGATYASPQKMLDELVGTLTFDPLAFTKLGKTERAETLRRLVGVDFKQLDADRQKAYTERTGVNAKVKQTEAQLAAMPIHEVPDQLIDISAFSEQIHAAEVARQKISDAERKVAVIESREVAAQTSSIENSGRIARLTRELEEAKEKQKQIDSNLSTISSELVAARAIVEAARENMPNVEELQKKLAEADGINDKVRANARRAELAAELLKGQEYAKNLTTVIEQFDADKVKILAGANWPVPGLGLNEHGVTLDGLPFEQASTAQQLRTSVAVGLALNPNFKVLLIKFGNDLDSRSLKLIAEQAAAADAQLWIERVAESKDGVSVLIEDGHVA